MMSVAKAAATYRADLGDGLVERWSTTDDADHIADLVGRVFREKEDEPLNQHMMYRVSLQMCGECPFMEPGDYALIEDTGKDRNPIVACTCLWRHKWEYEGIPFGVGRPEYVATDPAYRKRGLIRRLFEMLHARSAAEGHLAQGITGIHYFYRQFGYEYALDVGGRRVTYLALIPPAKENTPEPYMLREATNEDIPRIMELYGRRRAESMVWAAAPERFWRAAIEGWRTAPAHGKRENLQMIVDASGEAQGYLLMEARRWGPDLAVYSMEVAQGVNLRAVMPPLLRALQAYGQEAPPIRPEIELFREISFYLGRSHPAYDALGQELAPHYEPPYAWYVRVPDMPAFLQHIAPVLERRLANSVVAGYTGEFKLDCYRDGLRLVFDQGRLTTVERWEAPPFHSDAGAGCPALLFLQLVFGYRSLDGLRAVFPDVWVNSEPEALLKALFPARLSWVMSF